jgi:hypothetical protein
MSNPTHFCLNDPEGIQIVYPEGYHYQKLMPIPCGYWQASEADREEINQKVEEFMRYLRSKLQYM